MTGARGWVNNTPPHFQAPGKRHPLPAPTNAPSSCAVCALWKTKPHLHQWQPGGTFPSVAWTIFVSTPANNLGFPLLSKSKPVFAFHATGLPSGVCGEGQEKAKDYRCSARPLSEAGAVFSSACPAGGPGLGVWGQPGKLITGQDYQGPNRARRGEESPLLSPPGLEVLPYFFFYSVGNDSFPLTASVHMLFVSDLV